MGVGTATSELVFHAVRFPKAFWCHSYPGMPVTLREELNPDVIKPTESVYPLSFLERSRGLESLQLQ